MYNAHYDTEVPTCPYCDYEDEFDFLADKEDYIEPGEYTCSQCGKTYELCTNVIGGEYELWSTPLQDDKKRTCYTLKETMPEDTRSCQQIEIDRLREGLNKIACSWQGKVKLGKTDYMYVSEYAKKILSESAV